MKLVFVSSTFKDMQFERDKFHSHVAPLLDAKLEERGEAVYFGDLRWGVNTSDLDSDESNKKVLSVCLDEIDNAKPYMIVFIGERYGWIPSSSLLDQAMVMTSHPMFSIVSIFAVPWFPLSFANWVIFKAFVLCFLPNISNTASVFSHANIAIFVVHCFSSSFGYILVAFHISTAVSLISFVIFITSAFVLSSFSISSNKVHIT